MNAEEEYHERSGDRLVSADTGISESHLREFRMGLEQSVQVLEQSARRSQRNTVRFFVAVVACYASVFLVNTAQLGAGDGGQWIGMIWVTVTWIALIGFALSLVRYWIFHRPALERARTDLQIAMFGELHREVSQLRTLLDHQPK